MEDEIKAALKTDPKTNKELRQKLGLGTKDYDSKLDRTLQRLRKEGKIQVINGKWVLNTIKICPHCKGKGWTDEG